MVVRQEIAFVKIMLKNINVNKARGGSRRLAFIAKCCRYISHEELLQPVVGKVAK